MKNLFKRYKKAASADEKDKRIQTLENIVKKLKDLTMHSYLEGGVDMRNGNVSSWRDSASKEKLRRLIDDISSL